jgi:hypothetical protein
LTTFVTYVTILSKNIGLRGVNKGGSFTFIYIGMHILQKITVLPLQTPKKGKLYRSVTNVTPPILRNLELILLSPKVTPAFFGG